MGLCPKVFLLGWIWMEEIPRPWTRSLTGAVGRKTPTKTIPSSKKAAHQKQKPSRFLTLPPEIRLQIYTYLLPNVPSYTNGISDPVAVLRPCLRLDSTPSYPEILFTCRQIYHEAVPLLYHSHRFNFDIAGHLLRSVANRRNRITAHNLAMWLGLSSYFKERWPAYEIDNLDYTRMEEVCVTFWPVHGDMKRLQESRNVLVDLLGRLRKAEKLRKVIVIFRDGWKKMVEVGFLLDLFGVLKGVEDIEVLIPGVGRRAIG